ncbi:hypothetical protein KNO81_40565 [Paraburkholderia sediminicola]|nr:hypothetical protein [Paraburkholderia sediminicola]
MPRYAIALGNSSPPQKFHLPPLGDDPQPVVMDLDDAVLCPDLANPAQHGALFTVE